MFASDYDGRTALHQACQAGQLDAVKFLVALKDADVNVKDHDGDTPMCDAVTNGHTEVAEFLKANGGVLSLRRTLHRTANVPCLFAVPRVCSRASHQLSSTFPSIHSFVLGLSNFRVGSSL